MADGFVQVHFRAALITIYDMIYLAKGSTAWVPPVRLAAASLEAGLRGWLLLLLLLVESLFVLRFLLL